MKFGPIRIYQDIWGSDQRDYGAPRRVYIHTPTTVWVVGQKAQVFDYATNRYTDEYRHVVHRPRVFDKDA